MGATSDPIADLLTRMRNAKTAYKRFCDVPHSKIKEAIVKVLKEEGYIAHFLIKEENKKTTMRVFMKYTTERKSAMQGITRMSRPSRRYYVAHDKIPYVYGGMGTAIVSTPKGVLNCKQARAEKVGGELLCMVW